MRLLVPLGLLGLTGLIVLLIIYIIKPSYENRAISSTYIWKESLKYRKKEKTDSVFRNLLIILCQVLIITLSAFILATPLIKLYSAEDIDQNIIIIDGSANMMASKEDSTRFEKAKNQALSLAESSINDQIPVSIIFAGEKAEYVVSEELSLEKIDESLSSLQCCYGSGDVEGAMNLAKTILSESDAQVYYYTATHYQNTGDVNVVDVSSEDEWNTCVLDVRAEYEENYYVFTVDVAVYGSDKYLNIYLNIDGANDEGETVYAEKRVNCQGGETATVEFGDLGIYRYDSVEATIKTDDGTTDNFEYDDTFRLYGGRKETIKIQYSSTLPNNFFSGALMTLQNRYKDTWDIVISQPAKASEIEMSGFDLYIFEHSMPAALPTDGVVLLVNPNTVPYGLELTLGESVSGDFKMTGGVVSPIMNYIDPTSITATTYRPITSADGFETIMYCEGDSVFAVKNTEDLKIAVLTINLNMSNLAILYEFPVLINNIFEYFIPSTLQDNVFDVGEEIEVQARGSDVKIVDTQKDTPIEPPLSITINTPGSYKITQMLSSGKRSEVSFFVKISAKESNINRTDSEIAGASGIEKPKDIETDIYIWLAAALLAILFLERLLQSRKNI